MAWNKMQTLLEERNWTRKDLRRVEKLKKSSIDYLMAEGDSGNIEQQVLDKIYDIADKVELPEQPVIGRTLVGSFWMRKGGSGKTTTAANLSWELSKRGYNVLLLDADSQKSLTSAVAPELLPESGDLADMNFYNALSMRDDFVGAGYVRETDYVGLDIVPGTAQSFNAEKSFCALEENIRQKVIRKCLATALGDGWYDFIFFDLYAKDDELALSLISACDFVVAVVSPDEFTLETLPSVCTHLNEINAVQGHPELLGVLLNKADNGRAKALKDTQRLVDMLAPNMLFETQILSSGTILSACSEHQPVGYYRPKSASARQYSSFADEFISRAVSLSNGREK